MSSESSPRFYRQKTEARYFPLRYTIRVDSQSFTITDVQLQLSEPGNLLNLKAKKPYNPYIIRCVNADLDDDDGKEEDTVIETDVNLFRLIHAHLQGFEIFPLPPQGIPFGGKTKNNHVLYLSPEATLKNLLRDATDFGFTNLVAKIKQEMAKASKETKTQLADDEAAKEFVILD